MSHTILAASAVVIALELGILIAFLAVALIRFSSAAKSFEVLAYRVEERVGRAGAWLSGRWLSGLETLARMAGGFFGSRSRR